MTRGEQQVNRSGRRARRVAQVVAVGLAAGLMVACQPAEPGETTGEPGAGTPGSSAPSKAPEGKEPGDGAGKGPAKPSKKPGTKPSKKPDGGDAGSSALTCGQLQNANLQTDALELPDAAPPGPIRLTNGRWEAGGVLIELQSACGIGDVTGDPAADAVGAIKVTGDGTGRFYTLVTWRNDGGTPVPVAAAALGDRTPVVSVDIPSAGGLRQATVVYRTRGAGDPSAIVTITRTAVYEVTPPTMTELHHSDAPYTP